MDASLNGYYKVDEHCGGSLVDVIMYNPDNGDILRLTVEDFEYEYGDGPFVTSTLKLMSEPEMYALRCAPFDGEARFLYRKQCGIIEEGDWVQIVSGRKYPIGTEGRIKRIYDICDRYGRKQATYCELDTGEKTSICNVEII